MCISKERNIDTQRNMDTHRGTWTHRGTQIYTYSSPQKREKTEIHCQTRKKIEKQTISEVQRNKPMYIQTETKKEELTQQTTKTLKLYHINMSIKENMKNIN